MHPTRIFKKPEELLNAFEEYKAHVKEQSKEWLKIQYVGKEGERVTDALKVPLTIEGFKVFCYKKYGSIHQYLNNQDGMYNDFLPICSYIKEEIRENQIIGGMLGLYNPSITQRLNGLKEQTDVTTQGEKLDTNSAISITIVKPEDE
jgi:hypothetical protein